MQMRHFIGSLFLMLMFSFQGRAMRGSQGTGMPPPPSFRNLFNSEIYSPLNTAGSEFYLSEEEKLLVALCNLARYDGKAFIREVLIPSGIDTSLPVIKSNMKQLAQTRNLPPLMPAYSLHKTAFRHARDMGIRGDSGHIDSEGNNFLQRIAPYFPGQTGFAENYYLGSGDASEILLAFFSIQREGHDYAGNILLPSLQYIGVSIQPHRLSCSNTVLDFAAKPRQIPGISQTGKHRKKTEAYFMDCPKGRDYDQAKKNRFSLFGLFSRNP